MTKVNPITWLWAVSGVGVQGPSSALVPPHGTESPQLSAFSLDAVAEDHLVSLSHPSKYSPAIKNSDFPRNTDWI